jgi:hypothetical protein
MPSVMEVGQTYDQVVSRPERKLDWVDCSCKRRPWHSMYSVHHHCPVCSKDLGMFYLPKKASEWVLYGLYGPLTNKKTNNLTPTL